MSRPADFRGVFRTDEDARAVYAEAAGIQRAVPRAVAVPADVDDVQALVAWARTTGTPLVPRGSGSSMAGGAVGDGVVLDLSRLDAVGDPDVQRGSIRAGPGALRAAVDRRARREGLRFPVDPSSGAFCTVGGMAATNAAGARSLRFGSTRTWVRALDCVFDDGTRREVRRGTPPPYDAPAVARFHRDVAPALAPAARAESWRRLAVCKNSSGYAVDAFARSAELVELLVGSEGTLAIFVGVELDLVDTPAATAGVLGAFGSLERAAAAALRAREVGAAACELLDRTFLDLAAAGGRPLPVGDSTDAVLIAEVEGASADGAAAAARRLGRAFHAVGATDVSLALDTGAATELWDLRHAASPSLARLEPTLKSMQFIEDAAVPLGRLADYMRGVREILARHEVRGVIFGHAADAHIHVNPLVDVSRPDWRERALQILDETTDLVARLGGTPSGEHGDGRLRTPLLGRVWDARAREEFMLVKRSFDPTGILNPGVKVPLGDDTSPLGGDVKYDPALPPLPEAARRALERVADERAYAEFRLDLLAREGRGRRAEGGVA
ncbi:MAG: FAD-binding oxidoreductase [Gemmatimonadaceae bacterium]